MLSIKNPFQHRRTTVIAATANPAVLTVLWQQPDLCIREARTTAGINALLQEAQLVILDPAAVSAVDIDAAYIPTALAESRIPHTDSLGFLADPVRWLDEGAAFAGQIRSLPPRVVVFTSLASGGVGKTTLTIGLARRIARRTRLPVAIVELCHGASGFLTVLDAPGFSRPPVDAYTLATQGGLPGHWRGLTVVPMEGRQGALLTPADFGELLHRLHGGHVLTIVDAVQPHPLWPPTLAAADHIFVVAAANRPDTVANAQVLAGEQTDLRFRMVINQADRVDRLAGSLLQATSAGVTPLTIPARRAIAQYTDALTPLTTAIWPSVRL